MTKESFLKQMRQLIEAQEAGYKVDDALGCDISCEGFLGNIITLYAEFVIEMTAGDKELPDEVYENFWNFIYDSKTRTDEDIESLYKELTT